eukprot:7704948-Karenia_brevis.AAC.1
MAAGSLQEEGLWRVTSWSIFSSSHTGGAGCWTQQSGAEAVSWISKGHGRRQCHGLGQYPGWHARA